MKKFFLALAYIFIFCITGWSQNPYAITIDKSKGLPSNSVFQIFQDSKGFIWLATGEGLCRYDGFEFKTYSNPEQTSKAGSNIHEDKYGRIWYENFDGYLYYAEKDSLKSLKQNTPVGYHHFGIIKSNLFVVQKNGIDIYNLTSLHLTKTVNIDAKTISCTQQTKTKFYVDEFCLDEINEKGIVLKIPLLNLPKEEQPSLLQQANDEIFLVSKYNQRRLCYKISNNTLISKFSLPDIDFIQTTSYTDDKYWFCTPKGVYAVDENGTFSNNKEPYFSNKSISCVLKDREGNFWFSTTNEGILFVPNIYSLKIETPFKPFRLALSHSTLYVGTKNDELYNFDLNTLQAKLIYKGGSNLEVYNLRLDSIGKKILYTSKGLKILSEQGQDFFSWEPAAVKDIKRISEKYYAYAASGIVGLLGFDDKIKSEWDSIAYKNLSKEKNGINVNVISGVRGKSVVYSKNNNTIYYATNNGLYSVKPKSITELKYNNKRVFISKIEPVGNKIFGLSTQGRLYEINKKEELVLDTIIYKQPINNIICQNQLLFILTEKELLYYDFIEKKLNTVIMNLQFSEITDLVVWKKQLIMATNLGLLFYNLEKKKTETIDPIFILNYFKVNDQIQKLNTTTSLDYFENNIEINYSIISFKTDSKFSLYYKINNSKWELTSSETRTLKLASLAPGNYTISFRLGERSNLIQTIRFNILKPLWLRNWFLFICFIIISIFLYGYYKWQTNALRKRNRLLSEKIELEKSLNSSILKSIKSQMNPHFFYNALNTIQSFIFTDDKKNATNYLSKFSKLTRLILEMSDKEKITLAEELNALNLYLEIEKVRFNNDFDYSISLSENIDKELTKIPSMLVQPYIENAIKHGLLHKKEQKILSVAFKAEENHLMVIIDDNGIGRKRSEELNKIKHHKSQSFSTNANQKRLEILNRGKENKTAIEIIDKMDNNQIPIGTTIIITIPIK